MSPRRRKVIPRPHRKGKPIGGRHGNPVHDLRVHLGMTLDQLSERSGVGKRTLVDIEAGIPCRLRTALKVAAALSWPADQLAKLFPKWGDRPGRA